MSYIYKPASSEVDQLREVVDGLNAEGFDVGISKLYGALVRRAINDYRYDTEAFIEDMRAYLAKPEASTGRKAGER